MLPRLVRSTVILWLALATSALAQAPAASSGRSFHLALPNVGTGPGHVMRINITAVRQATVTLTWTETGAVESASLNAGARWEREIRRDSIMVAMGEHVSQRTLWVSSSDLVTVNVVSDAAALSDGYTALPTESLGFEYVAMSYPGLTPSGIFGGFIAVIATLDNTEVQITPSVVTAAGNPPGIPYTVTLEQGELYQVVPSNNIGTDLTGSLISSDKPVAVLSGHAGVFTLDTNSAINALIDQMVPVTDWGGRFHAVQLPSQPRGRYRIYARTDSTRVVVNGALLTTLSAGQVHEFTALGAITVDCSAPAMLAQMCIHRPDDIRSDPSLMIVNPIDSYDRSWVWSTPTMPIRTTVGGTPVPWNHYVVITAPSASRGSVRLDGNPVNFAWPHADGAWHTATVLISPGPHTITSPAPVNAQIVGESDYDAYGMPAGMRLREPLRADSLNARTCAGVLDTLVTVLNLGAEPVQITGATFAIGSTSQYVSPTLPFQIPAGTSRLLRIRVALPRFGLNRDTLALQTAVSGSRPVLIPIAILRDSLAIETVPANLRFDPATGAAPVRDTTVLVINRGTAPIEILRTDFTGPFSRLSPPLPAVILPGETLFVRVRFAPPKTGEHAGSMTIVPGPCGDVRVVGLSGQRLAPSSLSVRLDPVPVLTCDLPGFVESTVVVRNEGGEPLRFDSLELRGPGTSAFSVTAPPAGTVILPGDSIVAMLRFFATAAGDYQILIRVWNSASFDGYELVGPLVARREIARIEVAPGAVDYGIVEGCDPPPARTVELVNGGTVPIVLDSVAIGEHFVVTGATGTVAPGATASLTIRYAPRQPGAHRDTLRVFSSPCQQETRVVLSGEQRGAALTVPDSIDLGLIPDCLLPRLDTLLVRNGGATPLTLTQVTVSGGFALDTLLDSTIAPGADGRIVYSWSAASGEALGEVLIAAEPCALRRRVALHAVIVTSGLELSGSVDFGTVARDVPVVRTATLTNTGQVDLRITALDFVPPRDGLRINAPIPPFILTPGASIPVELELRSSIGGVLTSSLTARADSPCALSSTIPTTGAVLGTSLVTASLPDTTGWIDSLIALPLSIERSAEGASPTTVVVSVHWDRSMLDLFDVRHTGPGTARLVRNEIVGGVRVVVVEYRGTVPSGGVVVELLVRALLGSSESTPLIVDTVLAFAEGPDGEFEGRGRNGSFTTLGVCRVGGTRLVRVQGVFAVTKIAPNPAAERLAIELVGGGSGTVRLTLVDAVGRPVFPPVFSSLTAGVHSLELPVASLPAGTYVLHVESGPRRESHIVTILR